MKKIALLLFATVSFLEFYGELTFNSELMFFTKPFALPLLMVYYSASISKWNTLHRIMMAAFFFSWVGDISLMLTPNSATDLEIMGIPKNQNLFVCGIGAFLVTQLLFINAYLKTKKTGKEIAQKLNLMFYIPFVAYWVAMLFIVVPAVYTNPVKTTATIPIIIYASILVSMAAVALSRFGFVNQRSFWMAFIGSIVFVISDSLIALNHLVFDKPWEYAGFFIFTTYILAEYLIAEGVLNSDEV